MRRAGALIAWRRQTTPIRFIRRADDPFLTVSRSALVKSFHTSLISPSSFWRKSEGSEVENLTTNDLPEPRTSPLEPPGRHTQKSSDKFEDRDPPSPPGLQEKPGPGDSKPTEHSKKRAEYEETTQRTNGSWKRLDNPSKWKTFLSAGAAVIVGFSVPYYLSTSTMALDAQETEPAESNSTENSNLQQASSALGVTASPPVSGSTASISFDQSSPLRDQVPEFRVGDAVRATWRNSPSRKLYDAEVKGVNPDGTLHLEYSDGDIDEHKSPLQVFPLHKPTSVLPVGTRVSAEWLTSGDVYRGTITEASFDGEESEYTILFDDGTAAPQKAGAVWPLLQDSEFTVGQRVSAHYKDAMGVYLGRISAIKQEASGARSYSICFDDGDEDSNVEPGCIVAAPVQVPRDSSDRITCWGVSLCPEGRIQLLGACGGLPTTTQMLGEMLHLGQTRGVDALSSLIFSYNFARFQDLDGHPTTSLAEKSVPVITADHTPACWSLYESGKVARVADNDLKHFLMTLGTANSTEQIAHHLFLSNVKTGDTVNMKLKAQARRLRIKTGPVTTETAHPSDHLAFCKVLQVPLLFEFQKNAQEDNAEVPASVVERQLLRSFEIAMPNKIEGDFESCYGALRQVIVAQHLALHILRSPALADGAVDAFLEAYDVSVPSCAEMDARDQAAQEEIVLEAESLPFQIYESHDGAGAVACGIVYEGGRYAAHKSLVILQKVNSAVGAGDNQRKISWQLFNSGGTFEGMNHFGSMTVPTFSLAGGIILTGTSESMPAKTKEASQRSRHETLNAPFAPGTPHDLQVAIVTRNICSARAQHKIAVKEVEAIRKRMEAYGDFKSKQGVADLLGKLDLAVNTVGLVPVAAQTASAVSTGLSVVVSQLSEEAKHKEKSYRKEAADLQYALRDVHYWWQQENRSRGWAWENDFIITEEDLQKCPRE